MGFSPSLINRMINLNEDVIGVGAPRRKLDLKSLHSGNALSFEEAVAQSVEFVVNKKELKKEVNGFAEVDRCGTGILLVSRKCIEKMISECEDVIGVLATNDDRKKFLDCDTGKFLMPFKKVINKYEYHSEDYSFCQRWTKQCHGKIYVNIDSYICHTTRHVFKSRLTELP